MRIYSMTATFGKLEHETLTLQPGFNIIEAPNEWGKSTWCAFLVTMLYGLDTRVKTTKAALADKERYAPWSGSPMSGRIDLCWNGRDITIERSSKGRTPLGIFRAYETATGLEVPELTAANCGQTLLGVERSVFTRAGFLRFSDLPVTQDDALRHRLNALVTTGDESGAAEALGQKLRDLKNHCRYNRSGLLPQAESQRAQLEAKLRDIDELNAQSERLRKRHGEVEQWIAQLENHKAALHYAAAKDDAQRVEAAAAAQDAALERYQQLSRICAELPDRQEAQQAVRTLEAIRQERDSLQMEEQMLPKAPELPHIPDCFRGIRPEDAVAQAEADRAAMTALSEPKTPPLALLSVLAIVIAVAAIAVAVMSRPMDGAMLLPLCLIPAILALMMGRAYKTRLAEIHATRAALCRRYGNQDPREWITEALSYETAWQNYRWQLSDYNTQRGDLDSRREKLQQRMEACSSSRSLNDWQTVISNWDALSDAHRTLQQAESHLNTLRSMAKAACAPAMQDTLTHTESETNRLLSDAAYEQRQLQRKLGQCIGQMESLGSVDVLRRELDDVQRRIHALEQTYTALEYAQNALAAARQELQRRFAPRITKRAQELFTQLTGGRYDRLTLGQDLSVQAGAQNEDTLRSQQWRSDGTIDQLYLALRLAVAQELTPEAPLILDDALVRFDDTRLAAALQILRQESETKQVLLFTCQGREKNL